MYMVIPELQVELFRWFGYGSCIFNKINTFNYAHAGSKLSNFSVLLLNTGLTTTMLLQEIFAPLQMGRYFYLCKASRSCPCTSATLYLLSVHETQYLPFVKEERQVWV